MTLLLLIVTGCAKEYDVAQAKGQEGMPYSLGNVSFKVTFNEADFLFFDTVKGWDRDKGKAAGSDALLNEYKNSGLDQSRSYEWEGRGESLGASVLLFQATEFTDSAWAKRKTALLLGRCKFSYDFSCYFSMDGMSALIYNVAYLFSVPRKVLTSIKCADGIIGYLAGLILLIIGTVASIVGIFLATLLGVVCHPIETCANITAGLFYFGPGWRAYVMHTNIIASFWDLVWGGIIYPLWQALVFWI